MLLNQFDLERCPLCSVAKPRLELRSKNETTDYAGRNKRIWITYICMTCGGAITACGAMDGGSATKWYPEVGAVDLAIPDPASSYLKQAKESLHAPAGAAMLAASSVDAMLKAKGFEKGTLYSRIDEAKKRGSITEEMGKWAHQVRLDANEPRHADTDNPLPSPEEATRTVEFAEALAQFLFVLPSRVTRGVNESAPKKEP